MDHASEMCSVYPLLAREPKHDLGTPQDAYPGDAAFSEYSPKAFSFRWCGADLSYLYSAGATTSQINSITEPWVCMFLKGEGVVHVTAILTARCILVAGRRVCCVPS